MNEDTLRAVECLDGCLGFFADGGTNRWYSRFELMRLGIGDCDLDTFRLKLWEAHYQTEEAVRALTAGR